MIGFDKVFDTNYGADLTITEEANELIETHKIWQKKCRWLLLAVLVG